MEHSLLLTGRRGWCLKLSDHNKTGITKLGVAEHEESQHSRDHGHLDHKFQVSLGCRARPCLTGKTEELSSETQAEPLPSAVRPRP